jgi:hypothetical protein
MQSLFARRRVESGGRGDEEFLVRLAVGDHRSEQSSPGSPMGDCRDDVCGDYGWVRAEFKHSDAEEETCDDDVEEYVE